MDPAAPVIKTLSVFAIRKALFRIVVTALLLVAALPPQKSTTWINRWEFPRPTPGPWGVCGALKILLPSRGWAGDSVPNNWDS